MPGRLLFVTPLLVWAFANQVNYGISPNVVLLLGGGYVLNEMGSFGGLLRCRLL
jgi:hypothetical protein